MTDHPTLRYRSATEDDRGFLRELYILTDQWGDTSRPVSEGIEDELELYVNRWTPDQPGVILEAVTDSGTLPVGGAWLRMFTADDPGAGFVADGIPEVDIAVHPDYAGHGRGTALMAQITDVARHAGFPGVCLAVDVGNDRARHVYSKLGYGDRGLDPSGRCHVMLHEFS